MTILQKLQLKQSEIREQLNTLLGLDTRTEEQDTELGKLTTEGQKIEPEIRAAIIAAPDEQTVVTPTDDPEQRERLELRAKARVSDFLVARLRGQAGHWGVFGVQPIGGLRGRDPDVVAARTGNPRGCGNPGTRHASDDAAPDPRLRVSSADPRVPGGPGRVPGGRRRSISRRDISIDRRHGGGWRGRRFGGGRAHHHEARR